ncbi:hypothetical protein YC2023_060882 [Brassica napus]
MNNQKLKPSNQKRTNKNHKSNCISPKKIKLQSSRYQSETDLIISNLTWVNTDKIKTGVRLQSDRRRRQQHRQEDLREILERSRKSLSLLAEITAITAQLPTTVLDIEEGGSAGDSRSLDPSRPLVSVSFVQKVMICFQCRSNG